MAKEHFEREQEPSADVEDVGEQLDCMIAMARLDLEAAAAYVVSAESADDADLAQMLRSFAADHRRHVEEIRTAVLAHGMKLDHVPDPQQSVLVALALAAGAIEDEAIVENLIANEHLTNGTYDAASWVISDERLLSIVERGRADERNHLSALAEYEKNLEEG